MAKKFKFTDLAYDEIKPVSENKEETKENVVNSKLKTDGENNKKDFSTVTNFKKNMSDDNAFVNKNANFVNNAGDLSQDALENTSRKKRVINYDIDYSEYEDSDINDKQQNNSVKKNVNVSTPSSDYINFHQKNDRFKTQLKTYSSVLEKDLENKYSSGIENNYQQTLSGTMGSNFSPNKIKDLISFKEKLDVKTNIYLKSSIVVKLKELEKRTNESRSSIINKLLEYAIKNMEEN